MTKQPTAAQVKAAQQTINAASKAKQAALKDKEDKAKQHKAEIEKARQIKAAQVLLKKHGVRK